MRFYSVLILVVSAGTAEACPSFGLSSPYLSDFFCSQFDDIAGPKTRAVDSSGSPSREVGESGLTHPEPEWMKLPAVQDAWRSDPAKTLKLIERIREAGGRPMK